MQNHDFASFLRYNKIMLKVYYTLQKTDSHRFLFRVLKEFHGVEEQPLLFGEHGKPFLKGEPVFLSISHSADLTAVAVSDTSVGLDVEYLKKTGNHAAILNRLTALEREEITDEVAFFKHWTAKESYIKLRGETLASLYQKLSYVKSVLFLNGLPLAVKLKHGKLANGKYVYCICNETDEKAEIIEIL